MREKGYYWVKTTYGEWNIEYWSGYKWSDHGCQDGNAYYVSFFAEINESRILNPAEIAALEDKQQYYRDMIRKGLGEGDIEPI